MTRLLLTLLMAAAGSGCAHVDRTGEQVPWIVVAQDDQFVTWITQDPSCPIAPADAKWEPLDEVSSFARSNWKGTNVFVYVCSINASDADSSEIVVSALERAGVAYGHAFLWNYPKAAKSWIRDLVASLPSFQRS